GSRPGPYQAPASAERRQRSPCQASESARPGRGQGAEAPRGLFRTLSACSMERVAMEGLPRFQCPPDFSPSPFASEELRGPSKELWLIRAPADFSPDSLDGCAVPLVGFQTLKTKFDGTPRVFDIHSALEEPGSPYLLVSSTRSGQLSCAAS
ncbi:CD3E antigen, epsilon polypeptide associated protein, partial [Chelydra serpentina]